MKKFFTIACAALVALSLNSCNTADNGDALHQMAAARISNRNEPPATGNSITKPVFNTVYTFSSKEDAMNKISEIKTAIQPSGGVLHNR